MNFKKILLQISVPVLIIYSALLNGCSFEEPSAPTWDVDLNIPITTKSYNIFDILKRSGNISFDSLNNDLVFLYGESNYKRNFGEDIKFDGLETTEITAPSTLRLDTSIVIDDSTFVSSMDFLNGELDFTFFNKSVDVFSIDVTIKNLFRVSDNDTARISGNIEPGSF